MTTKEITEGLYKHLTKMGQYVCTEVETSHKKEVTSSYGNKYIAHSHGKVDVMMVEKCGIFRFYEVKISVSDFHSKNGHNFNGNYNYYVMPIEIYEKVKSEIPDYVGCLIPKKRISHYEKEEYVDFTCIKKPKRQELKYKKETMLIQFITSQARELCRAKLGYFKAH